MVFRWIRYPKCVTFKIIDYLHIKSTNLVLLRLSKFGTLIEEKYDQMVCSCYLRKEKCDEEVEMDRSYFGIGLVFSFL